MSTRQALLRKVFEGEPLDTAESRRLEAILWGEVHLALVREGSTGADADKFCVANMHREHTVEYDVVENAGIYSVGDLKITFPDGQELEA